MQRPGVHCGGSTDLCADFSGGGFKNDELRLTRSFGKSEVITDFEKPREGGHGGSDTSMHDLIFRGLPKADPLGLRADLRAGALASLIGIAARRSIERGGQMVKINDLCTGDGLLSSRVPLARFRRGLEPFKHAP